MAHIRFRQRLSAIAAGLTGAAQACRAWLARLLTGLRLPHPVPLPDPAPLPPAVEALLPEVDWLHRDVMVGTVRTAEQLQYNLEQRCYYSPVRFTGEDVSRVAWIALHEEALGGENGILRRGRVLEARRMPRGAIPTTMRRHSDPREEYWFFTIEEWLPLARPIAIQDSFRGRPRFTASFLLEQCRLSYQLFSVKSPAEFRLMAAIDRAFDRLYNAPGQAARSYPIGEDRFLTTVEDGLVLTDGGGKPLDRITLRGFARRPLAAFTRLKLQLKEE